MASVYKEKIIDIYNQAMKDDPIRRNTKLMECIVLGMLALIDDKEDKDGK